MTIDYIKDEVTGGYQYYSEKHAKWLNIHILFLTEWCERYAKEHDMLWYFEDDNLGCDKDDIVLGRKIFNLHEFESNELDGIFPELVDEFEFKITNIEEHINN